MRMDEGNEKKRRRNLKKGGEGLLILAGIH